MHRLRCVTLLMVACTGKAEQVPSAARSQPSDSRCDKLWDSAPPPRAETDFDRDWFLARCQIATAEAVTPCMKACDEVPSKGLCWALKGASCVQEATTKSALASDLAAKVIAHAQDQALTLTGSRLALPAELAVLSLHGQAWASKRDEGMLLYLTTWRGRHANTAGLLYRSSPWGDVGKTLTIAGLPFETAIGGAPATTAEPEPFRVVEKLSEHWLVVYYSWD